MRIWIINPFDQLPNETDVPLRYWALCRTFAEQGHEVIWWSSDFSHLYKKKRSACPDTDGFSVRLIETPPYSKNISFARLKNHKAFAKGFYREAMAGLTSGELKAPDRIVVSLPPLGIAEKAFSIRAFINHQSSVIAGNASPSSITHQSLQAKPACEVCVDIMDAWPETFYQALPKPLRKILGPILLAPMHRSAKRAYCGADKISAVGQSYLDLAKKYLGTRTAPVAEDRDQSSAISHQSSAISHQSSLAKPAHQSSAATHLCYHGTDLERFAQKTVVGGQRTDVRKQKTGVESDKSLLNKQQTTNNKQPLKAVYLGAMGSGYDLETIIDVAARWKAEGSFPFQIHFAGDGPQREALEAKAAQLGLTSPQQTPLLGEEGCPKGGVVPDQPSHLNTFPPSHPASSARVVFHGFLQKDAINELLLASHVALVPNRPGSLVACPYKAGEYAAAGLPILSCLEGELGDLLDQWDAGSRYNEGDAASLHAAFKNYSTDLDRLKQQRLNARDMAEALFDRKLSYQKLTEFMIDSNSLSNSIGSARWRS